MRKAEPSEYMKRQLGLPLFSAPDGVTLAESVTCDLCGAEIPVTLCEHGYPQDELYPVTIPERPDDGIYDPYCGCDLYICKECVDAVYRAIDKRAQMATDRRNNDC